MRVCAVYVSVRCYPLPFDTPYRFHNYVRKSPFPLDFCHTLVFHKSNRIFQQAHHQLCCQFAIDSLPKTERI